MKTNNTTSLINITTNNIGGSLIETVNARELHEFLEVGRDFTNWIKGRIEQYGFVEGQDFTPILAKSSGGRPSTEYHLSLNMAKELSMVERNEKGKQARRYFIECERIAQSTAATPVDNSKVIAELSLAECYDRMLRPAPSSKVLMLQTIAKNNGLDPSFLPAYAVDAPSDSAAGSSESTAPISTLLKENGVKKSAKDYNLMLQNAGLLERRTRRSTADSKKVFWCVTERGLLYGKNITSPYNPRETQPHWYVSRFSDLHQEVYSANGGAA